MTVRPFHALIVLLVLFGGFGCARTAHARSVPTPEIPMIVAATDTEIVFHFDDEAPGELRLLELDPWLVYDAGTEYPEVWSGPSSATPRIPRTGPEDQDRLYRQFAVIDAATGIISGAPQFVTDLSGISARTHKLLFPEEIKGVTCVVDVPDALELGIGHANSGIDLGQIVNWRKDGEVLYYEFDGVDVPLYGTTIALFDATWGEWTRNGVLYTPILINLLPDERDAANPLIHPQTDMENNPMGLGAFDMTDAEGVRTYIAAIEYIVERYTREDAAHGQIAALIIGNELQAHWTWHNMGNAPAEQVIREYTLSMRLADLAARSIHRDFKIYNSMTHFWSMIGYLNDPLKEISGIDLLDGTLEEAKRQGDFPWHIAHHP